MDAVTHCPFCCSTGSTVMHPPSATYSAESTEKNVQYDLCNHYHKHEEEQLKQHAICDEAYKNAFSHLMYNGTHYTHLDDEDTPLTRSHPHPSSHDPDHQHQHQHKLHQLRHQRLPASAFGSVKSSSHSSSYSCWSSSLATSATAARSSSSSSFSLSSFPSLLLVLACVILLHQSTTVFTVAAAQLGSTVTSTSVAVSSTGRLSPSTGPLCVRGSYFSSDTNEQSSVSVSSSISSSTLVTCKLHTLNSNGGQQLLPLIKSSLSTSPAPVVTTLSISCTDILHPSSFSSSFSSNLSTLLSQLEELNIDNCKLTEVPALAFAGLPHLQNLTVRTYLQEWSDDSLSISPSALGQLSRLERLDLSQNNIQLLPGNVFCDVSNKLTFLNLTGNQFSEVASLSLSGKESSPVTRSSSPSSTSSNCELLSLTRLEVTHNKIKVLTDRGFSLLPSLETLLLGHNLISRAEDTSLQGLSNLKRLDLANNELVALPPRFFQPVLSTLEDLYLQNNSISVLPPGLFHGLRRLGELDLSHNEITSHWVGPETFSDLTSLRHLDLSYNKMSRIDAGTFKSLTSLNVLQLHHNEIESIAEDAFASLFDLQTLVLSHNHLTRLDSLPFSGLKSLNSLAIDNNRLESLHDNLFGNVTSLFELNLAGNKLRLVPGSIEKLNNLRSLDLSYNLITDISNTSYQGIEQLYGLNLECNRIGNLTKGIFSDLPSLRILNLAKNNIASIAQGTFDDVPDLHALRLDSNKISDVNGLFSNLRYLLMLNISVNRISWFDYALIPVGLQWLDIHGNQIEAIGNYFQMESQLKLKSLDVSGNRIQDIEASSFPDGIEIIYIYNNSLRKIDPYTFMGKQNLTRVDLTGNKLQTVDSNSFRLSKQRFHRQLPEFSVSNNPFVCDCNMEFLKSILTLDESGQYPRFVDASDVNCQLTFKKYGESLPLMQVKSQSFLCPYKSHCFALCHCCDFDACDCEMSCPEGCSCYYDQAWSTNIVDCSASGTFVHKTVPSRIPMDVTELYLDSNEIHSLSSHAFIGRKILKVLHLNNSGIHVINNRTFNGLKSLQVLNLRFNQLTTLYGYEFEKLFELRELYLSHNKISSVANNTFSAMRNLRVLYLDHNFIMEFQVWTLNVNSRLQEIQLSWNSWSCECRFLRQYTDWLSLKQGIVTDADSVQCVYNETNSLTLLANDFNVSSCTTYSPPGRVVAPGPFQVPDLMPVAFLVGSLGLLMVIAVIVVLVYRRELSVWFYSKYGVRLQGRAAASREEEKLFDCFISYSKKDEAFVTQILAPELEYGTPPFRLCLHYRDLPVASGYLSDAIVEAMEASRRSILVISENFLKGEWCRYEFKSAHLEVLRSNQRHKLILIFIGKINAKDFDPDIRFWLKTSTFLQWGEKLFWEKLRYALPEISSRKPYPEMTRETVAVHI